MYRDIMGYKDLLKSLISPARLDRIPPNFAGRCIEAIDMLPMSFNLCTRSKMAARPPSWIY